MSADSSQQKRIDWKQIGRFVSVLVKLFSHITETFKKIGVGPEIFEWITGDGKDVFEKSFLVPLALRFNGKKLFRNWKEICKIDDWCLRMALARADLSTETGRQLQVAFPECFCESEFSKGPVPLSFLQEEARRVNVKQRWGFDHPEVMLSNLEVVVNAGLPFVNGCWSSKHPCYDPDSNMWVLLDGDFKVKFGQVVELKGAQYFVAEVFGSGDDYECMLVPAEYIDPTK